MENLLRILSYEDNPLSYAYGMDIFKLLWLFVLGSFMGYLIEMLWYRHLRGKWINRRGVLYGPFSPIYGIAVAGFVLLFYKIRNGNLLLLFLMGSIIGGGFEYFCGFLQEKVLGTKSWDYSKKAMNIHGRICLEFAVYWGIIACFMLRICYPAMSCLIENLPRLIGIVSGFILFLLLSLDCMISIAACLRQKERRTGKPAETALDRFLDKHYPDKRLSRTFTEIRYLDNPREKESLEIKTV